ncbi:MAG: hypothetical protein H6712_07640 [Myxococcales bacterium]|nr:hypothetical protein [Myxococcales bacterium]
MRRSDRRPSPTTWALLAVTVVSVAWAHLDARDPEGARATLVSTRSSAWRILPEIANTDVAGATVELWPSHGDPVRLVPDGLGHRLLVGETELGPADPDAVEGVWDSLRMATTLRAVEDGAAVGLGAGGRIVVQLPQGGTRTLVLGRPTADGAGLYGAVEGGAEGTEGQWVLEQELGTLVEQAPHSWLARRLVVAEPSELVALHDGELDLRRGIDGLWRARLGEGPAAVLDRIAVETRLDRLLSARLDPLVEPRDDAGEPWVTLEQADGRDWALRTHGACPGRDDHVLVDRGPGRWGCIDAALVQPWPLPGRPGPDAGALVDPRLLPHAYGRVLQVELRTPASRVLRRYGGGWRIEEEVDGRTAVFDVDEPEAYRWYEALHDAEVSLDDDQAWPEAPAVDLTVVTDSTATLRLRCTDDEPRRCRRDEGPVLRLRQAVPPLAFDTETFAERRLSSLPSEEARAIEVLAGADPEAVVRQSMHLDLGVWRLDAPVHPAGDGALDELRLEALLGTLGGLRAEAWVDAPSGPVRRRLRVERVPRRGEDPVLELALYDDCVAEVEGQRPARLSEGACETLGQDLLVMLPIARAVIGARGLELSRDGETLRLRPRGDAWADEEGGAATDANAWLAQWLEREAVGLRGGERPSPVRWTLRVLPTQGTAFVYEGGEGWVGLEGAGWWYALPAQDPARDEDGPDAEAMGDEDELPDEGERLDGDDASAQEAGAIDDP